MMLDIPYLNHIRQQLSDYLLLLHKTTSDTYISDYSEKVVCGQRTIIKAMKRDEKAIHVIIKLHLTLYLSIFSN